MNNTILIGMPGSGKTTVAELYKSIYGGQVYDTDACIENEYGNISDIFSNYGEEYFRGLETETVRKVCMQDNSFVSTGGGCVLREENVKLFKASGKIVYLRTRLETLLNRLEGDASRPLLQGGLRERLTKLYNDRTPVYERAADIIIDSDGKTPKEVLEEIFLKSVELNGRKK